MATKKNNKQQAMNKEWIFLFVLCILTACNSNTSYHSYRPVPNTGWQKNDTLFYSIPESVDTGYYDMLIGIRHLASYPYRDIWLEIGHNLHDSVDFHKDTIHLYLANQLGDWYGNGIGGLYQYTKNNVLKLHLQTKSSLTSFYITHLMSDSLLKSIYDIGIQLQKSTTSCSLKHQYEGI